jgi:hypothetical protein
MKTLTLTRLVTLGAIALLPVACASGNSIVTPSADGARTVQSGGTGGGGGVPGGGGGGGVPGGGGGGGAPAACQPLPGTCVLNATITLPARLGGFQGQIRFERSPSRVAVTGTLQPGIGFINHYITILIDSPLLGTPGAITGYAARGYQDQFGTVTLETIPGDGLWSQTPNAMPLNPIFSSLFLVDPTPPSPEVIALFAAVHSGSSVRLGSIGVPSQTCPCPPPGTPTIPGMNFYDVPPSTLK